MRLMFTMILACLLTACTNKSDIPSGILGKEKMEKVMLDMIMADRFAERFILKDSAKKNVKAETFKLYNQVFAIHNISNEEFFHSYKFYLRRPDLGKIIFDSVAIRANRLKEEQYKPKDSIPGDTLK